jgi:phosphoglycolate phosphatase
MSTDARATGRTAPAPVHAVCFDLDGTLLDTAADIALALRRAFADRGLKAPTDDAVRQMIGKGSPTLVARAMAACGVAPDAAVSAALVEGFFHHYGHLHDAGESTASPYPGVLETLPVLTSAGLALAVVTNKQHRYACDLLDHLGLSRHFDLVVGGDTCERRKPDPLPLQWACDCLGVSASSAVMVGDSINDVQAARGAGMRVYCVPYGYNETEDPRLLPCDGLIDTIAHLPRCIGLAVDVPGF